MDGWFEIESDATACMMRLTMGGFFDAAGIERLRVALIDEIARLPCLPNQHLTLCDITAMNIQSRDAVTHFTNLVGSGRIRSRRLAFVTGATLARLQARRLTDRDGVAFFGDREAASAWLRERPSSAAA